MNKDKAMQRCAWVKLENPLYCAYHDEEWGVPVHDDTELFEFLILEGAQAGLSWETVLNKRAHYRQVFDGFAPEKIARYSEKKQQALLQDAGIIRNRLKVASAISNAQVFLEIQQAFGSFDAYIWGFVEGVPIQNSFRTMADIPAQTPLATTISKDLKKRGMRFVGPTIIYAYMQAIGMVNDHEVGCFRYHAVQK